MNNKKLIHSDKLEFLIALRQSKKKRRFDLEAEVAILNSSIKQIAEDIKVEEKKLAKDQGIEFEG